MVTVSPVEGERTVAARYLVAADGMHCLVRRSAGIDFGGDAHEGSFVLADVRMQWSLGRSEVSLSFAPGGMAVVAPLPNGAFPIVAPSTTRRRSRVGRTSKR